MNTGSRSPALREFGYVTGIVGVFWWVAMHYEFSEHLAQWLDTYERFQLDEMPLTLLVLSLCLAWFAFRRMAEVSNLLATNRDLTQRLITAQEDERRLLAQELHDEVGQVCTALRIEAAYITQAIYTDPLAALAAAQRIDQSSSQMHSLTRDMLKRLRPPSLDSLGFEASLRELCQNWQQQSQIPCQIDIHAWPQSSPHPLNDALCISLYRVTQEALSNIAQHARASQVRIHFSVQPESLVLCITDNGHGLPTSGASQGLGLIGMRERIASLQGHLDFEDAQPGLRIRVQVPIPQ